LRHGKSFASVSQFISSLTQPVHKASSLLIHCNEGYTDFNVAHYFKFHSLAEIDAEVQRLGLNVRFTEDFEPLFRPVQVGPYRVGNSFAVQPMEGCDGTLDGQPDELVFRRYERFGAGGAKLIWGEATAVVEEGRGNPRQLLINDHTAVGLEKMLDVCRTAH